MRAHEWLSPLLATRPNVRLLLRSSQSIPSTIFPQIFSPPIPEPDLVGLHETRRVPVGEHHLLLFLDAVFHVAAPAVQPLVECLRLDLINPSKGRQDMQLLDKL